MWDTVAGHVDAGTLVPRTRTSADDLEMAATWLEAYEWDSDDASSRDTVMSMASVAARLRREAARRQS